MNVVGKFIVFTAAVLMGAALLSPPLYWLAQLLIEADILPVLKQFRFPKYFNRAALICALVGVYPFLKSLGLSSWRELGILPNIRKRSDLMFGIGIGILGLGLTAWTMVASGHTGLRASMRWDMVAGALGTAIAVAIVEELFFRGVLYGLLRRHLGWFASLNLLSLIFAALHFLKPHPSLKKFSGEITWSSGFDVLPKIFWQYGEPHLIVGGLLTLVLVGWILGYVTEKTKSLWMAIGIHAGWVFALRTFMFHSKRVGEKSFWFGSDLITGGAPLLLLALTLAFLIYGFRRWPRIST